MGLVVGAVIGAAVAVIIYKNNRSEVFADLKKQLEKYFNKFTQSFTPNSPPTESPVVHHSVVKKAPAESASKITVELPPQIVETSPVTPAVKAPKPRKFIKPKR